jgi:hypothetical protein
MPANSFFNHLETLMNLNLFLLSLLVGVAGPAIAIRYLRPILAKVMLALCDTDGGSEFWIRCAYLLAICGTSLLILTFGHFEFNSDPVEVLRRVLLLVFMGVFISVAIISRNIWQQVRQWLARQESAAAAPAKEPVPV